MPFAWIRFLRPGQRPDNSLPPGSPGAPDQGLPGEPEYPDNSLPGGGDYPSHRPIPVPPLPGIWPQPGTPTFPIYLPPTPPGTPSHPIYIEGSPEHPIALPPGHIWPPLPPDTPPGKIVILAKVAGSDTLHWVVVEVPPPVINPTPPPQGQPKR